MWYLRRFHCRLAVLHRSSSLQETAAVDDARDLAGSFPAPKDPPIATKSPL
jgi:hypothetical protein